MVALKRAIDLNSFSGICLTKLDVLDGLETIKLCVNYELQGKICAHPPFESELFNECKPVYSEFPGWKESTAGIKHFKNLPINAQKYILAIETLAGIPIDIISTGSDRNDTILLRNPFDKDLKDINLTFVEEEN